MRRQLLCGAIGILTSLGLSACQPYYYGQGYYGYNGYNGYNGYQNPYGYGPYGAYAPPAPPAPPPPPPYSVPQSLSQTSYNFVVNLALNNSYEIEAGRLVGQRSGSPILRQFADRVVSGNATINQDLTAALRRNGTPVVTPAALDPRHQAMIGDLSMVQGPEFDRRYVVQQVVAHREAIAMLQNYIQNADNPALKQLAQTTLQAAQAGLQQVERFAGPAGV